MNLGSLYLRGDTWVVDVNPHVAIAFKRLFGQIKAAATSPFLLHDRPDIAADLAWFMQRYPLGVRCHSLEIENILECLSAFVESGREDSYKAACKQAFESELNAEHFRGSLARLLQVDREILSVSD